MWRVRSAPPSHATSVDAQLVCVSAWAAEQLLTFFPGGQDARFSPASLPFVLRLASLTGRMWRRLGWISRR